MFVDQSRFEPSTINNLSRVKIITYCGTVSPEKDGVNILLQSFKQVLVKHCDYMLRIIGRGETEQIMAQVKSLAKELSIEDKVVFTGLVPYTEMPSLLVESEILALARPDTAFAKYGFPTKLGEYLCTGNPVVVTNVGEIGNYLTDNLNCVMARPDSVEDFAEKLCWTIENSEEGKRIGAEGRKVALTAFSSSEQTKKALVFMESLI